MQNYTWMYRTQDVPNLNVKILEAKSFKGLPIFAFWKKFSTYLLAYSILNRTFFVHLRLTKFTRRLEVFPRGQTSDLPSELEHYIHNYL